MQQVYEQLYSDKGWFDETLTPSGWFADDLSESSTPPPSVTRPTLKATYTYESGSGGYLASHALSGIDASGTDVCVLLWVHNRNSTDISSTPDIDSTSFTLEASSYNTNVSGVALYYAYINDASATVTVPTSSFKLMAYTVQVWENVDQTDPIAKTVTPGSQFGSTASQSVTADETTGVLVTGLGYKDPATLTPVASFTETSDFDHADSNIGQGATGYVDSTGASQSNGWTSSVSSNYNILTAELNGVLVASGDTVIPDDSSWTFIADNATISQNHVISVNDASFTFIADNGTISQIHAVTSQDSQFTFIGDNTTVSESATVVIPNDSQFTFIADSTSITQNHATSANDSSFTFTADNGTISQVHSIPSQDSQFTFVADATTISQNHIVVPQDSQLTFIADTSTVNQNHAISSQDSFWGFIVDNTTVTIAGVTIVSQDALWTFIADSTTITQNHIASSIDAYWSFIADTTTITQNHAISPADSQFAFSADATTITQNHVLTAQDSFWSFVADNTTLAQNHSITSQDSFWSFIADNIIVAVQGISPDDAYFGGKPRKYYLDSDSNIYWVINENLGLVEPV